MTFSQKQQELLELAKKQGFITHSDLARVYSSPIARTANLERFIALKIFKSPVGNKFHLDRDVLNTIERREDGRDKDN